MRTSSVEEIILEVLAQEHAHLTSLQIFEVIRGRLPAVNQSTVYRALERLSQRGKVSISDMGTGAAVYESLNDGCHHHLVCQKCGQIMTIGDEDVGSFFSVLQKRYQFEIHTHHLILFGVCGECAKTAASG